MQCSSLVHAIFHPKLPLKAVTKQNSFVPEEPQKVIWIGPSLPCPSAHQRSLAQKGGSHLAHSLPLPSNVSRPRIDLIVFLINLHSKYSLQNVEESLHHVDATFFLGKVSFLATGGGGLPRHHGAAPGPHAADLRWPRARRLSPEPAVSAEELREPLPRGPVRAPG
ncbi:centromere protein M isoform 3-T3 [Molossus nigricans]